MADGFHTGLSCDHERVSDADVVAVGSVFSRRRIRLALLDHRLNPLTYGMAGLRRLLYFQRDIHRHRIALIGNFNCGDVSFCAACVGLSVLLWRGGKSPRTRAEISEEIILRLSEIMTIQRNHKLQYSGRRAVSRGLIVTLTLLSTLSGLSAQELDIEVTPLNEQQLTDNSVEDFTLTERSGRTVTREDLQGRPWLACFIFTRCAATCAKVTASMAELSQVLKETDVQLVSITVDPEFDTPEVLQNYAEQFRADPDRWWFVTGNKPEIYDLIHNSFSQQLQENPNAPAELRIIHSNNIMHVDASGQVLGKYNALIPEDMAALRQVLLRGKETPEKYRYVKPILGIRIGDERLASELATTKPPGEQDGEEEAEPAREAPEWVGSLPAVNATLNGLATLLLLLGYGLIRGKKISAHRNTMLAAFVVSIAFLVCYLIYHYYAGSKPFAGTGLIRPIYFSILITHIILAVPVLH